MAGESRAPWVERQLVLRGISDPRVLDAMEAVPRERFVPDHLRAFAYDDRALPISENQTISQPYIVAAMTEALRLRAGARALEIGTGSGYQTAVLAELADEVYTIERHGTLADRARERLEALGYSSVHLRVGDGTLGWPEAAPFGGIVVTAGAPSPPRPLLEQLAPDGGRLVIPIGSRTAQDLHVYVRRGDERERERLMSCRFVPLVGREGWEK